MTVTYGFYDSLAGDRKYNAAEMSRMIEGVVTEGIFQSIDGAFAVSENLGVGMNVRVAAGRAWLNLTWTRNDAYYVVTLDPSEAVLNRIDTIVIEVNTDVAVRANSIKAIKGTPGSSPVAPTLANTATLKQYPLANIFVYSGMTHPVSGDITNRIGVPAGTPYVVGVLSTLDSAALATLQSQITSLFNQDASGWVEVTDTWTYASANTVTVPSDATLKYQKGMKVRFKQGGSFKYFYVTSLTSTLLAVLGGSSYSVANSAITEVWYSFAQKPFGFPEWMPYTWTATPSGSMTLASIVSVVGDFKIAGEQLFARISGTATTGGTASTGIDVTLPCDVANADAVLPQLAATYDGTSKLGYAYIFNTVPGHKVTITKADGTNWGLGAGKGFRAMIDAKLA